MPSRLWSGFACLELSISAKAEGRLSLCKTTTIRRPISFTSAPPVKKCRSPRSSTTLSIRKPTASATRSRITAGVCARTASYGSVTVSASTANTTLPEIPLLWISLSRTATVPSATIFLTAASRWRKSSPTACCWSNSLPDCVNSIRKPIPSSSFGRITQRAFPTAPSPESSVARRRPSLTR